MWWPSALLHSSAASSCCRRVVIFVYTYRRPRLRLKLGPRSTRTQKKKKKNRTRNLKKNKRTPVFMITLLAHFIAILLLFCFLFCLFHIYWRTAKHDTRSANGVYVWDDESPLIECVLFCRCGCSVVAVQHSPTQAALAKSRVVSAHVSGHKCVCVEKQRRSTVRPTLSLG